MKKLAVLFLVVGALFLTSCVTNWQRNRKLNEEIFEKYLIVPMAAESIKCSTAPVVK